MPARNAASASGARPPRAHTPDHPARHLPPRRRLMSRLQTWLWQALLLLALAAPLASADDARPEPAPAVIAALEAAARGEPFPDDLHPETALSGRAPSPLQRAFDVRHYHLSLRVMPASRTIDGELAVRVEAREPLAAIELDLDPDLAIHGARAGDRELPVARSGGRFTVTLPATVAAGEQATVTVVYGGKPHVALAPPWYGGFVWSEVDGVPWFATAVQGDGCDLWWPCKDSFADKPDEGIDISVAAPRGVSIASLGTLQGVEEGEDGFDTWHWRSRHPYAGYAVAINGGPYELIEREYTGINGTRYPIQFWALARNAHKARALIDSDVLPDLAFFERLIGPYPWGDEKVGFVETPHRGMEHQTINGYGEQYARGEHGFDGLLHHELAHEWFGNVMTHARPEDAWLHEGYGSYMQAVYAEETVGRMGYHHQLYNALSNNENCAPVADPHVRDVGEAFDNRDIYTKGTGMLHTLREYIGEAAFWRGTRRLVFGSADTASLSYPIRARYRSTEDFIRIMSEEAGEDLAWLVNRYLREASLPALVVERRDGMLSLRWVTGDRPFPMPVEVLVDGKRTRLEPGNATATLAVAPHARVIIDPQSRILRAMPVVGDCAEQTEAQIEYNIERFTRMARDFGWIRDPLPPP